MRLRRWLRCHGGGLLAGLTAALLMTLVMALLRIGAGIPLPTEMGGDRVLPYIQVNRFLQILGLFGGPTGAKIVALSGGFLGQLVAGALLGLGYAAVLEHQRARTPQGTGRRALAFLLAALVIIWLASLALFWPELGTNDRGRPPTSAAPLTALALLAAYAGYGVALVLAYRAIARPDEGASAAGRRRVVAGAAGVVLAVATAGFVRRLYQRAVFGYDGMEYLGSDVQFVTPTPRFYVVTKNIIDPVVQQGLWRLDIRGEVSRPRSYSFADLAALPPLQQQATLQCISNPVGGGLASNTTWTGLPLRQLLSAAGPKPGVTEVRFHAADGYTHTAAIEKAMDPAVLVAYAMDGASLPDHHGFPVRIVLPGYYGEGSVKWVNGVELVNHPVSGYYEQQGWQDRLVQTSSRIDAPANGQSLKFQAGTPITVKGVAFAGDRGITRVEVSPDGGTTWQDALLAEPHTRLTWALWSFAWRPAAAGTYHLGVRATDGTGALQTAEGRRSAPAGATGYHQVRIQVKA